MPEKIIVKGKKSASKRHGFLVRSASSSGKKVIQRRRQKGRKNV